MIEAGSTRIGRWLRERRLRLALWVAVVEGLLVALTHDLTRWTVLVIAIIVLAFYVLAGRSMRWDVARQLSWIAAASQTLAILVVIVAFVLGLVAIFLVALFAVIALVYLFSDYKRT
jgi:apolipoprotein N-acyltransferase